MVVRPQGYLPYPREHLPEAGISRKVGAHDQCVDKEAYKLLGLGSGASRNRGAYRYIPLPRIA